MKRNVITILVIVLVICVLSIGTFGFIGANLYSQRPSKALEFNQNAFKGLDQFESFKMQNDFSGQATIETGIAENDNIPSTNNNSSFMKEYIFEEGKIFETSYNLANRQNDDKPSQKGTEKSREDLVKEDVFFLLMSGEEWKDMIKNNQYKVTSKELNGEKAWHYEVNESVAKKLFLDNFKKSIIDEYNSSNAEKLDINSVNEEFNGKVEISLDISEKTKKIINFTLMLTEDLKLRFNDKLTEALFGRMKELAKPGENFDLRFVLKKGYSQKISLKEIKFKNEPNHLKNLQLADQLILAM